MPATLAIDDFKPFSCTCEIRYANAYFLFDRTGLILDELRDEFTDVTLGIATPQQSQFVAEEGTFHLELAASRFTTGGAHAGPERFPKYCKQFFGAITKHLGIAVLTRIGLRYVLRKEFSKEDESKAALASMALVNLKPTKRFNSSDSPIEVMFRWEDSQAGAFVRLRAETVEIKLAVPTELQDAVPKLNKKLNVLTLDTDCYTVAPVEIEQWNAAEWVTEKLRIVRREVDGILQGGPK